MTKTFTTVKGTTCVAIAVDDENIYAQNANDPEGVLYVWDRSGKSISLNSGYDATTDLHDIAYEIPDIPVTSIIRTQRGSLYRVVMENEDYIFARVGVNEYNSPAYVWDKKTKYSLSFGIENVAEKIVAEWVEVPKYEQTLPELSGLLIALVREHGLPVDLDVLRQQIVKAVLSDLHTIHA